MDPSSILEALQEAVRAGLAAYEVYRKFKEAFDQGEKEVHFEDVTSGGSSSAPSSSSSPTRSRAKYPDRIYRPDETVEIRPDETIVKIGGQRRGYRRPKSPAELYEEECEIYEILGVR